MPDFDYNTKKRLLRLAAREEGVKDPSVKVKDSELDAFVTRSVDTFNFHEDDTVTGPGGETVRDWLERQRSARPDDFEGGAAPVVGNPSPTRGGGSDAADAEKARQKFGYSAAEWSKLTYMKRSELTEAARGASKIAGTESWRKAAPKATIPNGMSPEQFAALPVEERLRHANEAAKPAGWK